MRHLDGFISAPTWPSNPAGLAKHAVEDMINKHVLANSPPGGGGGRVTARDPKHSY
jgi:hypothetical protein